MLAALTLWALPSAAQQPAAPQQETPALHAALELQTAFAQVAERTLPSVVGISAYRRDAESAESAQGQGGWQAASRAGHPGFTRIGIGSGTVVAKDGYILTTYSLLSDDDPASLADRIEVEVHGWGSAPARLVGAEPAIDLAVLKVEVPVELPAAPLGDVEAVEVGHWAIALGDPPGPGTVFAAGTVSARPERECYQEQRSATLLQSSARVPPGSYGGPLVNIRGEVIGINQPPPPGQELREAFGTDSDFALPIGLALTLYEPLLVRESKRSPWLGISVLTLGYEQRKKLLGDSGTGILIDDIFDPSPASQAGLRVGDVLVTMGGEKMFSVAQFQRWLYLNGIGATVALEVSRDGQILERTVTIEERPASATTR